MNDVALGEPDPYGGTWVGLVYLLLWGLAEGTALAGLFLAVVCWARQVSYPRHPGEFLGLVLGIQTFVLIVERTINVILGNTAVWRTRFYPLWVAELILLLAVLLWAVLANCSSLWRVFFALLAALSVLAFAQWNYLPTSFLDLTVGMLPKSLPLLVLVPAIIVDRRTGPRRPWTHWFGIVTIVALRAFDWGGPLLWEYAFHG